VPEAFFDAQERIADIPEHVGPGRFRIRGAYDRIVASAGIEPVALGQDQFLKALRVDDADEVGIGLTLGGALSGSFDAK
jgi:hypothetical protein